MKISNLCIPVQEANRPVLRPDMAGGRRLSQKLPCRDPFIMLYDGRYYLYHSDAGNAIACRVSDDLENWSVSVPVFVKPEGFHGRKDCFWAPECHYFDGNFYIFTSVWSEKTQHRSISVYRAQNPLGPFEDIAGGCISPGDWDAIDGTLYVDGQRQPWMVFVHEWTCMANGVGTMCAAKLANDLTHFVSEPVELFRADDPQWAVSGVTDGPYLYTTAQGTLYMIWSNFNKDGYVVALARATEGRIDGRWEQEGLLYAKDLRPGFLEGGHAMIFMTKDGDMKLVFHSPNSATADDYEHVVLLDLIERNDRIEIG